MPTILRARKDLIDPRPIRIRPGPSFYNYYWKVWALLDVNKEGEYVLPFSRRLIHSDRQLWPRSHRQPPPLGYELCGCVGCEKKTWEDHILKDYDDDDDPNNGNLHLEEVYIEFKDEEEEKQNETSKDHVDDNDHIMAESDVLSSSSSSATEDSKMDDKHDSSIDDISDPPTPFAYDPYESYDWEC